MRLLTRAQVAAVLSVSTRTVSRLAKSDGEHAPDLPPVRVGLRSVRFDPRDVEAYQARQRAAGATPPGGVPMVPPWSGTIAELEG